jgi:hypothetical protein
MKDEPEVTVHAAEVEPTIPRSWRHPSVWVVGLILVVVIAAVLMNNDPAPYRATGQYYE